MLSDMLRFVHLKTVTFVNLVIVYFCTYTSSFLAQEYYYNPRSTIREQRAWS